MPLLGSALGWLAPMGVLLAWSFGQWREKRPGVPFTDHLRADPDASLVQRLDSYAVPAAELAEEVGAGHATVVEQ